MFSTTIIIAFGVFIMLVFIIPNLVTAASNRDFCYDQVGDGQECFQTLQKCKQEQKLDEIAESPCYKG
jgi:hypothetical protein